MVSRLPSTVHYTSIPGSIGRKLGFAEDELGEFDEDDILLEIEEDMRAIGVEPVQLGWGGELVRQLLEAPPKLLWNLNSGVLGPGRTAQVACLCEMLGIPLVGSGSWTASLVQDKTATYGFLNAYGPKVCSPQGRLLTGLEDIQSLVAAPFPGPYVLKANNDESSRGLIFVPAESAWEAVLELVAHSISDWGAVRLEGYISGLDISANAAVDETGEIAPLEPMIVEHASTVYGGREKALMSHVATPLRDFDAGAADQIRSQVAQLCAALRFRHYARFDFRWDPVNGRAFFLEANYCPSFERNDDFAKSGQASGLSYRELLSRILSAAEHDRESERWFHELPGSVRQAWTPEKLVEFVRGS